MENMEAALTHGPNDTYQSPPRKPHPVLKSPKYQQDRLNAPPMSSPEFFKANGGIMSNKGLMRYVRETYIQKPKDNAKLHYIRSLL